ncbi:MAG: hypothetical protein O2798_02300 [Chloroflexi bacterium]|nr:hypothetical protein [Chloroflexota bacterium]MDA1239653.1 hypothetical protein [Chloroflexota bacterium]MQC25597.1 hypothetical protein [Chloroflexota bacterium]MQC47858.1 hypothetical protein [Chloroflexota bacterium]
MPGPVHGPLSRQESTSVQRLLAERITRRVGFDVWTLKPAALITPERDPGVHVDEVSSLFRQLVTLHPALSITPYDLEQHADRARAAGITMSPTTVVRSTGRSVQLVGYFSGALFQALLDLMWFISSGSSPVTPQTRAALQAIEQDVVIEALVTPYEPFSVQLARVLGAFTVANKRLHVRLVEISEFPRLAEQRMVTQVPVLSINGRRSVGLWNESTLLEQLQRIIEGNEEPVIRDRIYTAPYMSEDQARALASQPPGEPPGGRPPGQPPGRSPSGLILPGSP